MKILKSLFASLLITGLFACGGASEPKNTEGAEPVEETTSASMEGVEKLDLSDHDLNATISIPDASKGKAEVTTSEYGSVIIKSGKRYGVEIVPFGITIEEKKMELADDLVYEIEYLSESESSIFYKKTIKDSEIEAEFHFFMTKELDGDIVEIKNIGEQTYKKGAIEKMIESAESFSEKTPA